MLRTLRRRLILSHIVPLLVVIPLMGIALIYVLETRALLPSLSQELLGQAKLVEDAALDRPEIWTDRDQAEAFVDRVGSRVSARVMLVDAAGLILASSDAADSVRIGQPLQHAQLEEALTGQLSIQNRQSRSLHVEVADVLLPTLDSGGTVMGIIRLSYPLTTVLEQFLRLRYLILAVLAAGLVIGSLVGSATAVDTQRPLQRATRAISQLASGQTGIAVSETGPEEIRVLAHSFNKLASRLHTLEESRRRLLANLVHELRRPLGALLSAIQALSRGADRDPALRQELLDGMAQQIQRLQRLVDDLMQLHKEFIGSLELDRQPLQLNEWLPPVLSTWREAAIENGLHWEVEIPDGLPTIPADADGLAQVIGNLVSNAIRYTPPRGTVRVDARVHGDSIWIRVSDTGPGIPLAEQESVFKPFYRGQDARRFPQGMGLGLSIAHDLIIAHGGQLVLESAPGSGSHFIIRLPLQPPQREESPRSSLGSAQS